MSTNGPFETLAPNPFLISFSLRRARPMPKSQMLFISHASDDAEVVRRIVDYLERAGITCWIAGRDIPPRAVYAEAITEAMRNAQACGVIVSRESNASKAVKRELELASRYDRPFIPIRIDDSEPGPGADYYLNNVQWIEYRREGDRALDRIVAHMQGQHYTPPPKPKSRNRGVLIGSVAAAAVIIAGVALVLPKLTPSANPGTRQGVQTTATVAAPPATSPPSTAATTTTTQAPVETRPSSATVAVRETSANVQHRAPEALPPPPPPPPPRSIVSLAATEFAYGTNVAIDQCTPGPGILANARPCGAAVQAAGWNFYVSAPGRYRLDAEYAAQESRPVAVQVNGVWVSSNGLAAVTGGWTNADLQWVSIANVELNAGRNTLYIARNNVFPHIHGFRFVPIS